jgi:hypothetical protein
VEKLLQVWSINVRHSRFIYTACTLLSLMSGAPFVDAAAVTQPAQRQYSGIVAAVSDRDLSIAERTTKKNPVPIERHFTVDQVTRMRTDWIGLLLHEADLGKGMSPRAGQAISVVATADHADFVAVLPPPPVAGVLRAITERAMWVQTSDGRATRAPETLTPFAIDPGQTVVREITIGVKPALASNINRLGVGRHVVVFAEDGMAKVIRIVPPPPVSGDVLSADRQSITVQPATRPSMPVSIARRFALGEKTRAFVRYPRGETDACGTEDINVGDFVSIYADDQAADAICVELPSVDGELLKVGDKSITVRVVVRTAHSSPQERTFAVDDDRTQIFVGKLGRPTGRAGLPGRVSYAATFDNRGNISDLVPGRSVLVYFRNGIARVIYMAPPISQSPTTRPS